MCVRVNLLPTLIFFFSSVEITKVVPAREKPVVNVDAGEVVMAKRSDEGGAAVAVSDISSTRVETDAQNFVASNFTYP